MQIEIDQSNKIEQTNRATIVAYANDEQKSLCISAKSKREIQKLFKLGKKPQMFRYKTFALLIYLLIKKDLKQIDSIIIDKEYTGWEDLVKNYLLCFIKKDGKFFPKDNIQFDLIGKDSNAHKRAIAVFRNNLKPDMLIKTKDMVPYLL